MRQMLIVWKGVFEDGVGLRCDSPDRKAFSNVFSNLQLPSPSEREGGCKALHMIFYSC